MKTSLKAIPILLFLVLCGAAFGQGPQDQNYVNSQQGFRMILPGPPSTSDSTQGMFAVTAFNTNQTVSVSVLSPNRHVDITTYAQLDQAVNVSSQCQQQ